MSDSDKNPRPDESSESESPEAEPSVKEEIGDEQSVDASADAEPDAPADTASEAGSAAPDAEAEPSPAPAAADSPRRGRRFSPVPWLALLISIGAVAAVGWLWKTRPVPEPTVDMAPQSSVDALGRSIQTIEQSVSTIEQRMSQLASNERARAAELSFLERELQSRLEEIDSYPDGSRISKGQSRRCRVSPRAFAIPGCWLRRSTTCRSRTRSCNSPTTRTWPAWRCAWQTRRF